MSTPLSLTTVMKEDERGKSWAGDIKSEGGGEYRQTVAFDKNVGAGNLSHSSFSAGHLRNHSLNSADPLGGFPQQNQRR